MSDGKILISSRKCHVALGCRVAYFFYQGGICPELCSKCDSEGIFQADASKTV